MYSCINPQRIYNKYIDKTVISPCGNCEHCRIKRSMELSSRIDREYKANPNCYMLTLTYDNESLPMYEFYRSVVKRVGGTSDMYSVFRSNRENYDLPVEEQKYLQLNIREDDYYRLPVGSKVHGFAHLCYEDVLKFIQRVRDQFRYHFGQVKKYPDIFPAVQKLFLDNNLDYESVRFRYFLCGEYGPTTLRPHYHLLLWFPQSFTRRQFDYVSQALSASWSYGRIHFRACYSSSVDNYLSGYVTSQAGLPPLLSDKSVRPFCTFSKSPTIGAYSLGQDTILEALSTGTVKLSDVYARKDPNGEKDDIVSSSLFVRHFPKCSGFGFEDDYYKLRIYSYVYNYFRGLQTAKAHRIATELGLRGRDYDCCVDIISSVPYHTVESVKDLRLSDIDFPEGNIYPSDVGFDYSEFVKFDGFDTDSSAVWVANPHPKYDEKTELLVKDWTYTDMYASLVCYRYCCMFNLTPAYILASFSRIYKVRGMQLLKAYYEYQSEHTTPYL